METKAHYALVGFFAIALIAAGALFAVWLGQLRFDQAFKEFDVVFEGPVRGLTESGEVRFNGIKVGEVTRLALDRNDPTMVVARIRIAEETPITRDSVAQLEPQGLTGLNYIQLNPGSPDSEPLVSRPGEIPRLRSRPAQLESLLSTSEGIAQAASEALAKINELLTEETLDDMATIIANARAVSDQLAGNGEGEEALVIQVRDAVAQIEATVKDVSKLVDTANAVLSTDITRMVDETTRASMGVSQASADAAAILQELRDPMARFANEGLDELALAIDDLRRLLGELEAIAAGVEDNPTAFVAGARREEVEIPR